MKKILFLLSFTIFALTAPALKFGSSNALAAYFPGHFAQHHAGFTALTYQQQQALQQQADQAAAKVSPAVVSLYGFQTLPQDAGDESLWQLFGLEAPGNQVEINAGTAFFVTSNGYLLTSNHVVADNSLNYEAVLNDGSQKDIQVVYHDTGHDIAVLKISGDNYPTANLGDSSQLSLGQNVAGMGNAFGQFANLTSRGAVSGLHQDIVASEEIGNSSQSGHKLSDLFQSTMQLYPGDSGGPTFDLSGNVVGINDAIDTAARRVSFSMPINYAKSDLAKVLGEN